VPIVFKILHKENKSTSNGNDYVECETDKGAIAVWGSKNNMTNIRKVENANIPFQIVSDRYVNPSWEQHSFWIPESEDIQIK